MPCFPSEEDHSRQAAGAEYEFAIRLREKNVLFTTADTGRHQAVADGGTIESINVCYLAGAQTGSIDSTPAKKKSIISARSIGSFKVSRLTKKL
jgi:hypothetical protein